MKARPSLLFRTFISFTAVLALMVSFSSCQSAEPAKAKEAAQPEATSTKSAAKPAAATTVLPAAGAEIATKPREQKKLIVYYFYTTYRCYSCHMIETLTKQAVESGFKDQIAAGRIEIKPLNIKEAPNEHFVKDYKLYTKSVVLSDTKGGKEIRWKNLEQVWQLLRDEKEFIDYVTSEVSAYLKG